MTPNETLDYVLHKQAGIQAYENKTEEFCREIEFVSNRKHHGHNLVCLFENHHNLTSTVTLQILYPAKVELLVLESSSSFGGNYTIEEHDDLYIGCRTDANPPTNATLQKKTESSKWKSLEVKPVTILQSDTVTTNFILMPTVSKSFSGFYRCITYCNESSFDVSEGFINVLYPAKTTLLTQYPVQIAIKGDVTIQCGSDSNPEPEIKLEKKVFDDTWVSLQTLPNLLERNGFITKWEFQLRDVNEKISGSYRCSAENGIGSKAFTKEISVFVESIGISSKTPAFHNNTPTTFLMYSTFVMVLLMLVVAISTFLFYNHKRRQSRTSFQVNTR
ncbi:Tyrosine-protein kinase-like otk [Holothuria leucospilota]|uniref:Tyrosine-protein kinase-like otk n=1 Tax=Holothuria leucospilota TaxID=206669 RepID=A0A9Q1BYF8_HOLLE|nr:Tyrosine-protein kinase-like otk [Holothuria leucospilota]